MNTTDIYKAWHQKVLAEGEAKGRSEGEAKGRSEGEAKGRSEGEAKGRSEGEANALLAVLAARGLSVTDEQTATIRACRDLGRLETWLRRAVSAASSEEVLGPEVPSG